MLREASVTIRRLLTSVEGLWYDFTRHVDTSGYVSLADFGHKGAGFDYLPIRPTRARQALHALPVNPSDFVFIDVGSGKGRFLFLAAEFPFRSIEGVEICADLHRQAVENIARFTQRKQVCPPIRSINVNATDYCFPAQNFVLCLYNPFPPPVLDQVLDRLEASLVENPRKVIVLLVMPDFAESLERRSWLECCKKEPRLYVYKAALPIAKSLNAAGINPA